MKAALISIGDELLIGQTINTNAAWLGKELSQIGIPVTKSWTISDDPDEICSSLDQLIPQVQLVILTGGLGPTKDDLTKYTLTKYFQTHLEIVPEVLERIADFFKKRGREMSEVNIQQAALPVAAEIMHNYHGTACGMWFEKDGCIVISLPGVPYEMHGIMIDEVFPKLKQRFDTQELYHQTLMTQGIGESFLAERIEDWENKVRDEGLGLAYLPSPGLVKLRLSSKNGSVDEEKIHRYLNEVIDILPNYAYTLGDRKIADVLGKLLLEKGMTIGTVESCTGGAIANELVEIAGSSAYYVGSIVAYSYEVKEKYLKIDHQELVEHGAVSEKVVVRMAKKGRKKLGVDLCIATSGIAGPTGGLPEKPVGTVWIAISTKNRVWAKRFQFGDNRERNITMTALTALNCARCEVLGLNS
ncbi:MAG: CinA family nicotinamide mononucleotide deamidase-related protein [Crocinitomicaceae bacterium]